MGRCFECGAETLRTDKPFEEVFRGVTVLVSGVEYEQCPACGERFFTPDESDQVDREVNDAYRAAQGLLLPGEIRALRQSLGLRQKEFERLLGVASPTASRWETGAVMQSEQADRLMHVLREVLGAAECAARHAGVDLGKRVQTRREALA